MQAWYNTFTNNTQQVFSIFDDKRKIVEKSTKFGSKTFNGDWKKAVTSKPDKNITNKTTFSSKHENFNGNIYYFTLDGVFASGEKVVKGKIVSYRNFINSD